MCVWANKIIRNVKMKSKNTSTTHANEIYYAMMDDTKTHVFIMCSIDFLSKFKISVNVLRWNRHQSWTVLKSMTKHWNWQRKQKNKRKRIIYSNENEHKRQNKYLKVMGNTLFVYSKLKSI